MRRTVLEASGALWRDARSRVLRCSRDELENIVDLLTGYLEASRGAASKNAKKHHPYFIAVSLRCIFEKYSSKQITSGFGASGGINGDKSKSPEQVSGEYANCLKELYIFLNVKGSPRYFDKKAKECTGADGQYCEIRENLEIASEKMREFRHLSENSHG